jgi:hypothetical protein
MAEDWSNVEVELIISDYFSMLYNELAGLPVNKTDHRIKLLPLLNNRSEGSIEFKHQNISAALAKLGAIYIKGYKPRWNYQKILDLHVAEYLQEKRNLFEPKFEQFAEQIIASVPHPKFEDWIDSVPEKTRIEEPAEPYFKPIKINYLEKEQRNRSIGSSGEELVIEYEKWRLLSNGKNSLADQIEWISKNKGDGAGYDILSRNLNGTDRYIEVKTTKLTKETPIYFSKTEFDFSKKYSTDYWLYRVFNIQSNPKMFSVNGRFDEFCQIEPTNYKGIF